MNRKFCIVGSLLIVIGIILGAFGAHGLKSVLSDFPEKIASFETGVRYQMYAGFSFLIIGLNASKLQFSLKSIFWFWLLGSLFFSGSIYFLAVQPILSISLSFLGPVTPLGGLMQIIGWSVLVIKFIKGK